MKHVALIAVSAIAIGLAGCNNNPDEASETADTTTATGAAVGEMPAVPAAEALSPGQAFANTAAASDSFEIESSRLAAEKASSAEVKSFAQEMIKAHTESTNKLKTAASAAAPPITPVAQMTPTQQQTLESLTSASGEAFDRAYAKAQVDAHQTTLDALKDYSANGDVPSLKTFATELVPIVTEHLDMAKAL